MNSRNTENMLNNNKMKHKKKQLKNIAGNFLYIVDSEKILNLLEEGRLYWHIQAVILIITALLLIISGINYSSKKITKIYESDEVKKYHVKKVSQIPKELEKEEDEKLAVEDEKLTEEELRERYFSYVVSKIESNKDYPISEQKKGHESVVVLKIFILSSGKVKKVQILQQAKYLKLTQSAINAIKRSIPFKPYSKVIQDDELIINIHVKFLLN